MKKFALVFPGQGSQSVGMFADFMDCPEVRRTYEEAADALGYDLAKVSTEGPAEELNRTEVTQPAILCASVAAFRAFAAACPEKPAALAGHSLGEYSALVAAGSLQFPDALKLVRLRGQAMQEAVPEGKGAMAAVLGLPDDQIISVCRDITKKGKGIWAANFNTPGQVVVSGEKAAVDRAMEAFTAKGAGRVVPLAVSAPSHCPLMQPAADRLKEALSALQVRDAQIPVYCNTFARAETAAAEIVEALVLQLTRPVRWVESVRAMQAAGVELLLEAGPGKVLCGLVRKIDRKLPCCNISGAESLQKALEALNQA